MGKKCGCGSSANNTYKGKPVCNGCLSVKTRGQVKNNTTTMRVTVGGKKKSWW